MCDENEFLKPKRQFRKRNKHPLYIRLVYAVNYYYESESLKKTSSEKSLKLLNFLGELCYIVGSEGFQSFSRRSVVLQYFEKVFLSYIKEERYLSAFAIIKKLHNLKNNENYESAYKHLLKRLNRYMFYEIKEPKKKKIFEEYIVKFEKECESKINEEEYSTLLYIVAVGHLELGRGKKNAEEIGKKDFIEDYIESREELLRENFSIRYCVYPYDDYDIRGSEERRTEIMKGKERRTEIMEKANKKLKKERKKKKMKSQGGVVWKGRIERERIYSRKEESPVEVVMRRSLIKRSWAGRELKKLGRNIKSCFCGGVEESGRGERGM